MSLSEEDKKKKKKKQESELEKIDGIGKQKRIALLSHFKSIGKIKAASTDELAEVKGISLKNAENIYNYFRKGK